MKNIPYLGILLFFLLSATGLVACDKGSDYRVGIELVEPLDDPPLSRAARLEILVTNSLDPEDEAFFSTDAPTDGFDVISLSLDGIGYYSQFVARASAFDEEGDLIAYGRTVEVVTRAFDGQNVALYLAPPQTATLPPVELTRARAGLVLASPNDADVLVIGGAQAGSEGFRDTIAPVEYFSPAAYTLSLLSVDTNAVRVPDGIIGHSAATLSANTVLVVGGYSRKGESREWFDLPFVLSSALADVLADVSIASGSTFSPRHAAAVAPALLLGQAWTCGGEDPDGKILKDCFRIDAETLTLSAAGPLDTPRAHHTMTPVLDAQGAFLGVVIYGGNAPETPVAAYWEADAEGPVSLADVATASHRDHAAQLLGPERVLIVGGVVNEAVTGSVRSVLTTCKKDSPCPAVVEHGDLLEIPRFGHTFTALSDTLAVACGGMDANGDVLDTCEFFKLEDDQIIQAGTITLSQPRRNHAALLLPDATVLIAGGYNPDDGVLANVEIVTPPR